MRDKMEYAEIQGEKVPVIGFGTYKLKGNSCKKSVVDALNIGYRHIDTAQIYGNEEEVGKAIQEADVEREEIFLTTKVWKTNLGQDDVLSSVDRSLNKLKADYVDLLLIHWPVEDVPLEETLEAMDGLRSSGKVRNLGVSNFDVGLLEEAQELSKYPIFTDQVKYNPFEPQKQLTRYCSKNDVLLTAYTPLAKGRVARDRTLQEIGEKHGKTAAQVALRWLIQQDKVIAIPKAAGGDHRSENFDVFDFELSKDEMEEIFDLS